MLSVFGIVFSIPSSSRHWKSLHCQVAFHLLFEASIISMVAWKVMINMVTLFILVTYFAVMQCIELQHLCVLPVVCISNNPWLVDWFLWREQTLSDHQSCVSEFRAGKLLSTHSLISIVLFLLPFHMLKYPAETKASHRHILNHSGKSPGLKPTCMVQIFFSHRHYNG